MDKISIVFLGNCERNLDIKKFKSYINKLNFISVPEIRYSKIALNSDYISLDNLDNHIIDNGSDCIVFISNLLEEDHFFVKTNYIDYENNFKFITNKSKHKMLVSYYQIDELLPDEKYEPELVVAFIITISLLTREFLKSGVKYWDIYLDGIEDSSFIFASNKAQLKDMIDNLKLGSRLTHTLSQYGYDEKQLKHLSKNLIHFNTKKVISRNKLKAIKDKLIWIIIGIAIKFSIDSSLKFYASLPKK